MNKVAQILFFIIILTYTLLIGIANSDLIDGRFSLHIDEQVLFDGVHRILNPDSKTQFLYLLFDGGDHRYGRLFWNINAIICYLPENIYGATGQIYFARMSSAFFLITSYIIFTITFLKSWLFRLVGIITLLAMPYTLYYMSMPKPEPLQLFTLSLFFYFFKKTNRDLNSCYWIFLGLAIGAKISTLPFAICIFLFVFLGNYKGFEFSINFKSISKPAFFTFLGLVISIPMLIKNFISSIIFYTIIIKILEKGKIITANIKFLIIVFVIIMNFIFTYAAYYFFDFNTIFKYWIDSLSYNIKTSFDNININYISWIKYFFDYWLSSPLVYDLIFLCSILAVSIAYFYNALSSIRLSRIILSNKTLMILSGLISLNLIFLKVDRLWGFYILPGFLFICMGTLAISEYLMEKYNSLNFSFIFQLIPYSFILSLLPMFAWWIPMNSKEFNRLSSRTKTVEYAKDYSSYISTINELRVISLKKNKMLVVAYDRSLFQPEKNQNFHIKPVLEPYIDWESNTDVLVFSSYRKQRLNDEFDQGKANYEELIIEKLGYEKFVINNDDTCLKSKCYRRIKTLENESEILVLEEY